MASSITIGIICFVAGLIIGSVAHRFVQSQATRNRRLERQMDKLNEQHTRYQAEVSEHFSQTAELLGKLNTNYRDIFNHLAIGAEQLCSDPEFKETVASISPRLKNTSTVNEIAEKPEEPHFEPPRDYAPKNHPKEMGTLSETYGFRGETTPAELKD